MKKPIVKKKVVNSSKKTAQIPSLKPLKKAKKVTKTVTTDKNLQFAIIEYSQTQIEVYLNTKFVVPFDKNLEKDQIVIFDKVLANNENIGKPYLKNFVVVVKCLEPDVKDKKIIVFKYKSKKNYRIKTGHRQHWSLLVVEKFQKKAV